MLNIIIDLFYYVCCCGRKKESNINIIENIAIEEYNELIKFIKNHKKNKNICC